MFVLQFQETSLHLGPQNLTPSVLSNPDALSMEPFAVQRRLRNLAHAIRTISRRLKRHSRPVLTTDTMNQVQSLFQPYDTVKEKEHKLVRKLIDVSAFSTDSARFGEVSSSFVVPNE